MAKISREDIIEAAAHLFMSENTVRANLKRVQEGLRALEEYGKLLGPEIAAGLRPLRQIPPTAGRGALPRSDIRSHHRR